MSLLELARAIEAKWEAENEENENAPDEPTNKDELTPWTPRPKELASWPVDQRQQWGLRANQLQDEGVPWPDHERQAFLEVKE